MEDRSRSQTLKDLVRGWGWNLEAKGYRLECKGNWLQVGGLRRLEARLGYKTRRYRFFSIS